jgi:oligopeptidase B
VNVGTIHNHQTTISNPQSSIDNPMTTPPIAKIVPHTFTHLRWTLDDPYAWLQDPSDPQVIAYLEAENAYARAMLQPSTPLQEQLYQEMRGRIQEDDPSAPQLRGGYWYYYRFAAGQQYRIFCRKKDPGGDLPESSSSERRQKGLPFELSGRWQELPEEILLDENVLAVGHSYCRVQSFEPSPDHTLLAYSVDTSGARIFDLYIKDIVKGEQLAGPIHQVAMNIAWASDSRTLFYTVFDAAHRPYQLYRYTLGQAASAGRLVYHEADDHFILRITRARSGEYLLLTIASQSTSEVRFLPADQPDAEFAVIQPRQHWLEYYADHHGDRTGNTGGRFLIRTNDGARNFKLVEAPVSSPGKQHWREVLPHREDTLIENVLAFREHLVVCERRQGLRQMRISDPDGLTDVRYVAFPEPVYNCVAEMFVGTYNPQADTELLRFEYSSLVTPDATVDYNLRTGEWQVKKQMKIPSGYDPSQYRSEQLLATAPDGAQVPISLVYRVGTRTQAGSRTGAPAEAPTSSAVEEAHAGADMGTPLPPTIDGVTHAWATRAEQTTRAETATSGSPLLLEAYGSYGFSTDADFDPVRLSLLERGFIYAIAHVRGGSELGRDWYDQGRLMHKKNTFTDFIACAEHLIKQGYTKPELLTITGGSAGGLLVSAVLNLRPDLFRAAVAHVPFTNVITAMLMPDLPLTVIEYEQWGNPAEAQAFEYMLSYSPYENVEAKAYPAILVRAGLNDLQVPYWDPAKWVARLRALKTDGNPLLLLTNMAAGHSGSSGRFHHLKEDAQNYAFLLSQLESAGI